MGFQSHKKAPAHLRMSVRAETVQKVELVRLFRDETDGGPALRDGVVPVERAVHDSSEGFWILA